MTDASMTDVSSSRPSGTIAALDIVRKTRRSTLQIVDALSPDALVEIPDGFSNHVLWNVGHLVVMMQSLIYGLSGLPLGVPDDWLAAFRKGSTPRPTTAWRRCPTPRSATPS